VIAAGSHVWSCLNIVLQQEKHSQHRPVITKRTPIATGSDPLHGEYIVNDAVVHVAKPSDGPHTPDIEHAIHDDAIVDINVDDLADDDRVVNEGLAASGDEIEEAVGCEVDHARFADGRGPPDRSGTTSDVTGSCARLCGSVRGS
jgi:hypothetical protein